MTVSTDIFAVNQIAHPEIRQIFRLRNGIQRVACGTEHGGNAFGPLPESLDRILAVIEKYAGIGMVDAVIDVVTPLAVPLGFSDDLRYKGSSGPNHEPARFRQYFHAFRKQSIQFFIQNISQLPEGPDVGIVPNGEPSPDIEQP